MFKFLVFALLQSTLTILASHAVAGCRQDPREAHLGQDIAKLKTYSCDSGGGGAIKVEFYRFANEAAATLASGRSMASMTKIIGKPDFVNNDVFNKFRYMVDRFGTVQTYAANGEGSHPNTEVNDVSFFGADSGRIDIVSVKNAVDDYPAPEILELNKQVIPDSLNVYYTCYNNCNDLADRTAIFWRHATLSDVTDFHKNVKLLNEAARSSKGHPLWSGSGSEANYDKSFALLRYLAGTTGLPKEFLILSGVYSQRCGEPAQFYWDFHITTPVIALEAAVIRNDKTDPLRVDSVLAEEIAGDSLRPSDTAGPADVRPSSLNVSVPPGHSLVIPTRIALKAKESYPLGPKSPEGSAETYRRLRSKGIATRADVFAVPQLKDYVFGPELKIAGLVVDGNTINFREKSQNFMDVAYSGQEGSCPYLLAWDNERRDWTEHGKVLHEANDASREQTQTIVLPGFVSRFRLEEREPEVATIEGAEMALGLKDGRSMTLKRDAAGSADTGRRLLFWGDAEDFEFQLPNGVLPADVVESRLSLTGYYERYANLPNADRGGEAFISRAAFSSDVSPLATLRGGPFCRSRAAAAGALRTAAPSLANFAPRRQ
jgi:hypothetical protein